MFQTRLAVALVAAFALATGAYAQSALAGPTAANPAAENVPHKALGVVTITGPQPTSLPTQIPATVEGVTREDIDRTINATSGNTSFLYSTVGTFTPRVRVSDSLGASTVVAVPLALGRCEAIAGRSMPSSVLSR